MRYLLTVVGLLFALTSNVIYADTCPATYKNLPFSRVLVFISYPQVECVYYANNQGQQTYIPGSFMAVPAPGLWQYGAIGDAYECGTDTGGSATTCVFVKSEKKADH